MVTTLNPPGGGPIPNLIQKKIDISDIKPCGCKTCGCKGFLKGYSIIPVPARRHPLLKDELIVINKDICSMCGTVHTTDDFKHRFLEGGGEQDDKETV